MGRPSPYVHRSKPLLEYSALSRATGVLDEGALDELHARNLLRSSGVTDEAAIARGIGSFADPLVPRIANSKICGNKWPLRNLLRDLSKSHLCFENLCSFSNKMSHF